MSSEDGEAAFETPRGSAHSEELEASAGLLCLLAAGRRRLGLAPASFAARAKMSLLTWLSRWLMTNGTPRFTASTSVRPSETIVCGILRPRLASTSLALMPPD